MTDVAECSSPNMTGIVIGRNAVLATELKSATTAMALAMISIIASANIAREAVFCLSLSEFLSIWEQVKPCSCDFFMIK